MTDSDTPNEETDRENEEPNRSGDASAGQRRPEEDGIDPDGEGVSEHQHPGGQTPGGRHPAEQTPEYRHPEGQRHPQNQAPGGRHPGQQPPRRQEGSDRDTKEKMIKYLYVGSGVIIFLFGAFATIGLYQSVMQVIDIWVAEDFEPVFSALFNLVVVLLAVLGLSLLIRRLDVSFGQTASE